MQKFYKSSSHLHIITREEDIARLPADAVEITDAEFATLNAALEASEWASKRLKAYPPLGEKADAELKMAHPDPTIQASGAAQLAAYYQACWDVKVAFPKI